MKGFAGIAQAAPVSADVTNYLPWAEAAVLTKLAPNTFVIARTSGIWMQISWVVPLLISLFFYFHVLRKLDGLLAFACTLPFVSMPVMWSANGGFSDFRMDLVLYLFFATTAVWFLATLETDRWYPWLFMGLAAGVSGLMRATAPIYLVVGLGPPLLLRLIVSPQRKRLLLQSLAAGAIMVAVCGWFFYINYDFLDYYYRHWNKDSHTDAPLSESKAHYGYVYTHIGHYLRTFSVVLGVVLLLSESPRAWGQRFGNPRRLLKDVNWAALYIGFAPVTMLVLQRAGLNPFVSLPACFGFLMFVIAIDVRPPFTRRPRWLGMFLVAWAIALLVNTAVSGIAVHTSDVFNPMEASMDRYKEVADQILEDVKVHPKPFIRFAATQLMGFHGVGFSNVLMFEYGFKPSDRAFQKDNLEFQFQSRYQPAVPLEWKSIVPGGDEDATIEFFAHEANKTLDYITVPSKETLDYAEQLTIPKNYANLTARRLCARVLALGTWEPIGKPIAISKEEVVTIYANRHSEPPATQP